MRIPTPSDHPTLIATTGSTVSAAAFFELLRKLDPQLIPYIAIGLFFVVSLLATFFFLLLRQQKRRRGYAPDEYPGRAREAQFAALSAVQDREVVNFIAGTITAIAGTALAVTRAGLFQPIFVGALTTVLAGFYFFNYRSLELHRRRLEAHHVYLLAMSNFADHLPAAYNDPDYMMARARILANIAAISPVADTAHRSGAFRRKDLKAAIDMIQAAAGLKSASGRAPE